MSVAETTFRNANFQKDLKVPDGIFHPEQAKLRCAGHQLWLNAARDVVEAPCSEDPVALKVSNKHLQGANSPSARANVDVIEILWSADEIPGVLFQ